MLHLTRAVAIAIAKLRDIGQVERAFVLDFDLHYGDGTDNILSGPLVSYFHPEAQERGGFIEAIRRRLVSESSYDILAVSAGFDRHKEDWGRMLDTEDCGTYTTRIRHLERY